MEVESSKYAYDENDDHKPLEGLKNERRNVILLLFLYLLQGVPLGLTGSVPYLMQSRRVSYQDQAMFSFANWPFSLKLLWAPLVDSIYWAPFGRRKSWLVPIQYLLGVSMFFLARSADELLGSDLPRDSDDGEGKPVFVNVPVLTVAFFLLNFLSATQDIAVDGWALNMLTRRNIGWASTCNTVGQAAGYLIGNIFFITLESTDFCNKYLRSHPLNHGIITLKGFLYFWAIVFFLTTTLLMVFKNEQILKKNDKAWYSNVFQTYKQLWRIICMPSVAGLVVVLLTNKIGFAAGEAITSLKLIESGFPRDHLAIMAIPLIPLEILLPVLITRMTNGPRPMDVYLKAMPYRLVMSNVFALVVWLASASRSPDGQFPPYFYLVILVVFALHQVTANCMFVSVVAFFAKVSDPAVGGTYMTLLNTISNLGVDLPATTVLYLVDRLTWMGCRRDNNTCTSDMQTCTGSSRPCTLIDGYYVECVICFIIGAWWIRTRAYKVKQLQDLPFDDWHTYSL